MLLIALLGFFSCVVFAVAILEADYRKGDHHDDN